MERGSREITLDDFWSLALDKMDAYNCLKPLTVDVTTEGDESSDDDDDDGEDDEDDEDEDGEEGEEGEAIMEPDAVVLLEESEDEDVGENVSIAAPVGIECSNDSSFRRNFGPKPTNSLRLPTRSPSKKQRKHHYLAKH